MTKPAETVSVSAVSEPHNLDTVANVSESNAPTNSSTVGRSAQTGDESQMDFNGAVAHRDYHLDGTQIHLPFLREPS